MNLLIDRVAFRTALDRVLPVVPARPLIPAHGQARIFQPDHEMPEAPHRIVIEATDGLLYARSFLPAHPDRGFDELVPAHKLSEMLKRVADPRILLDATNRTRVSLTGNGSAAGQDTVSFTFPLLADPTTFPAWQLNELAPVARGVRVHTLLDALNRVGHALAGPEAANPSLRLIQLRMGRAVAFSGRRLQEARFEVGAWNQQSAADPLPVLLPDVAVPALTRCLASAVAARPDVDATISLISQTRGSGEVSYVLIETALAAFAWPCPRIEFSNLEVTRANAARHRQASARLIVSRAALLAAVRAARIQADPDAPALVLDFTQPRGAPIRAVAGTDEANLFEMALPQALIVGNDNVHLDTASYLLDDLQAVLDACPDEILHLHIAPPSVTAASGQRLKPLTTLIDSRGALAVIPQRD